MLAKLVLLLAAFASASTEDQINSTVETSVPDLIKNEQEDGLSMAVHEKIYSYTKNSKFFRNFTFEETVAYMNDLYAWKAPVEIRQNFPYSHWGYDLEKRPVWGQEIGRQDWRLTIEKGEENAAILEKYLLKCLLPVVKSLAAVDTPDDEIRKGVFVWDMEGFDMRQLTHLPTVAAGVRLAIRYGDLAQQLVGRVFLINSNYATKVAADIARPLLGRLLENVEVYGSNRNIWLPRLLKVMPVEIIPPFYGGNENFKPVSIQG